LGVDPASPLAENRKIIYLNEDYTQAIVVGLTMRTLCITYRDPDLTKRDLAALSGRTDELGFKTRKLISVDQSECWKTPVGDKTD
jgi:apolipoprotein D and lipocalin family protein